METSKVQLCICNLSSQRPLSTRGRLSRHNDIQNILSILIQLHYVDTDNCISFTKIYNEIQYWYCLCDKMRSIHWLLYKLTVTQSICWLYTICLTILQVFYLKVCFNGFVIPDHRYTAIDSNLYFSFIVSYFIFVYNDYNLFHVVIILYCHILGFKNIIYMWPVRRKGTFRGMMS